MPSRNKERKKKIESGKGSQKLLTGPRISIKNPRLVKCVHSTLFFFLRVSGWVFSRAALKFEGWRGLGEEIWIFLNGIFSFFLLPCFRIKVDGEFTLHSTLCFLIVCDDRLLFSFWRGSFDEYAISSGSNSFSKTFVFLFFLANYRGHE